MAKQTPGAVGEEAELEARLAKIRRDKPTRAVIQGLETGWLPQGVRLVDPKSPEEGRTVVFSPDEAALLTPVLKKIASARLEGDAK